MKRMTKRFSRFPLKISGPVHDDNAGYLAPRNDLNDARSSKYSRNSAGITYPEPTHHPAMYSNQI